MGCCKGAGPFLPRLFTHFFFAQHEYWSLFTVVPKWGSLCKAGAEHRMHTRDAGSTP